MFAGSPAWDEIFFFPMGHEGSIVDPHGSVACVMTIFAPCPATSATICRRQERRRGRHLCALFRPGCP